jgi:MFS family permease
MKDWSFTVFVQDLSVCIPSVLLHLTNLFSTSGGGTRSKMTLGQVSEIFFLLIMPYLFKRLGVKKMILIGIGCWVARYLLFSFGNNGSLIWMFYLGILLHGVCYDFFFVTGQIFVDQKAPVAIRGAAQGFIAFVTLGIGMFIGAWASGQIVQNNGAVVGPGEILGHNWHQIWLIPALGALGVFCLFALFFRPQTESV